MTRSDPTPSPRPPDAAADDLASSFPPDEDAVDDGAGLAANRDRHVTDDEPLGPLFLDGLECLLLSQPVFTELGDYFRAREPEAAGLLLGPKNCPAVTHFLPDETGVASPASFTLDAKRLNCLVRRYLACGLDIKGVAHLHPRGVTALSYGDIAYARKIFLNPRNTALDRFLMPIFADGRLYGYSVCCDGECLRVLPATLVLF